MITVTDTKSRLESIIDEMNAIGILGYYTDSGYNCYKVGHGRRYYVTNRRLTNDDFKNSSHGNGIWITIRKYGFKYGILSRRFYGNLSEAILIASLWSSLVTNSTTCWKYGSRDCSNYYIYDTVENKLVATVSGN